MYIVQMLVAILIYLKKYFLHLFHSGYILSLSSVYNCFCKYFLTSDMQIFIICAIIQLYWDLTVVSMFQMFQCENIF